LSSLAPYFGQPSIVSSPFVGGGLARFLSVVLRCATPLRRAAVWPAASTASAIMPKCETLWGAQPREKPVKNGVYRACPVFSVRSYIDAQQRRPRYGTVNSEQTASRPPSAGAPSSEGYCCLSCARLSAKRPTSSQNSASNLSKPTPRCASHSASK